MSRNVFIIFFAYGNPSTACRAFVCKCPKVYNHKNSATFTAPQVINLTLLLLKSIFFAIIVELFFRGIVCVFKES